MNKKIPLWIVLLIAWTLLLVALIFGWAVGYIHEGGSLIKGKTKDVVLAISRFPTLVNVSIKQISSPAPLILKDRYPDIDGLKIREKNYTDSNYLLLSAYDKEAEHSTVKLLRLSDQKVLHRWKPDIKEIINTRDRNRPLSEASNKGNIVFWLPLLSEDGAIVFNTEDRALMKMDKDSKLIWSLEGKFHHSQEYDSDGNIWACSVSEKNPQLISRYFTDYRDDALAKVSASGKLIFKRSVTQILLDNGYRALVLGIGPMEKDPLHLNDIQPALTSSEYWLKGDLLVSIRNKSTVFLYRPSTNKIIWLQTGPWLNQHDVDFIDSTRIGVFGNNIIRNENYDFIDGHNEVYIFDFKTETLTTPYTEFLKQAKVKTMTGGRSDILANGDVYIEETDFGRILRGNKTGTVWEYVQRVDKNSAAVLGWSRIISPFEFKNYTFLKN